MHMADALVSPAVGGTMWLASAGIITYCSHKIRTEPEEKNIPLMGVFGAFLFAAQMINFTIPGTGSSGHLGGGLLLAILLGPHAAFLAIASVLVVQALFFADGGLLALGCNMFNLGFFPAFIAYPFIYQPIAGTQPSPTRRTIAALCAGVISLQMGAFSVVLETVCSGLSSLPFSTFALVMQPIHLAIGIGEGLITAAIVNFVISARPEIVHNNRHTAPVGTVPLRAIITTFLALTLVIGGVGSWFASKNPDGLEWSIMKVTGTQEIPASPQGIHGSLNLLQDKVAFLPAYDFKKTTERNTVEPAAPSGTEENKNGSRLGTTLAGLTGGIITLALACVIGMLLRSRTLPATGCRMSTNQ